MVRRSSAFASDLAELDNLQSLPLPTSLDAAFATSADHQAPDPGATPRLSSVAGNPPEPLDRAEPEARPSIAPPPESGTAPAAARSGTRATQVRLPPRLASWLGEEAHRTSKTLSTVVALAAKEHRGALQVRREDPDGLEVFRRVASGTVPVTLRLTGAQRQLLEEIAGEQAATRSAVVVAALHAATSARE